MHKTALIILVFIQIWSGAFYAQSIGEAKDSIEIYLIDSFVTPELPHTFVLSFFTSEPAKSKVLIDNTFEFSVSKELTGNHKIRIDLTDLNLQKKTIPFLVVVEDSLGNSFTSEKYEFSMPKEVQVRNESNFLLFCLFGGVVFGLPSPVFVAEKNQNYFSITKEIPVLSFRSQNFNYPAGYFSVEYTHIFKAGVKNFFRYGYKHIITVPGIEYIAPGINGFTNFNGFNGISPELSIGWVRLFNTFTVYTRYRYNLKPGEAGKEFYELSIGLYSSFFSIYF